MKIEDITESRGHDDRIQTYTDSQIKRLVNEIRKNINGFNGAKIDGQTSVLNVSGKQVEKAFGMDLRQLSYQSDRHSKTAWLHKNGRDNYSMGYNKK